MTRWPYPISSTTGATNFYTSGADATGTTISFGNWVCWTCNISFDNEAEYEGHLCLHKLDEIAAEVKALKKEYQAHMKAHKKWWQR